MLVSAYLLQFVQVYLMQWIGQKIMFDLRRDIFRHMQRMHIGFFDVNPVGRLVTDAVRHVDAVNDMFTDGVLAIINDFFMLTIMAAVILAISWWPALAGLRGAAADLDRHAHLPGKLPSGLNATPFTAYPRWAARGVPTARSVAGFHSLTVPSASAVARDLPSGLKARKIATLFYNALRHGMDYVDPGASYYETRYRERVVKNLHRRAKAFGFILQAAEMPAAEQAVS